MHRSLDCALPEIKTLPVFLGLSEIEIKEAIAGAKILTHYAGDSLFQAGDHADYFGYVLTGAYKLVHSSADGEEVIVHFCRQREVLALLSVFEKESHFSINAKSMGLSRVLMIPRQTFIEKWLSHSKLMHRFQSEVQKRMMQSYEDKRRQRLALCRRVAMLLLDLADFKTSISASIEIPLTRKEISNYVGASVESVIRCMSDWGRRNIIRTSDQHIEILQRSVLQMIANGEDENRPGNLKKQDISLVWRQSS